MDQVYKRGRKNVNYVRSIEKRQTSNIYLSS